MELTDQQWAVVREMFPGPLHWADGRGRRQGQPEQGDQAHGGRGRLKVFRSPRSCKCFARRSNPG